MKQPFETFYKSNFQALCLFIHKFTRTNVEELANDAFLAVYNTDEKLKYDIDRKNYLFAVAKNKCLNFIRPNQRIPNIVFTEAVPDLEYHEIPDTDFIHSFVMQYLLQQINKLPRKKQRILKLKYLFDTSEHEIAKIMSMKIKSVYNNISMAYNIIRQSIK